MLAPPNLLELAVRFVAAHVSLADRNLKPFGRMSNANGKHSLVEVGCPFRGSNSFCLRIAHLARTDHFVQLFDYSVRSHGRPSTLAGVRLTIYPRGVE